MKKSMFLLTTFLVLFAFAATGLCADTVKMSASSYKAGDTVTIEGTITPGQDLYIAIAQQKMFAPKEGLRKSRQKEIRRPVGSFGQRPGYLFHHHVLPEQ